MIAAEETIHTVEWCDGNGNLGPCMCYDGNRKEPRGHWRGGKTIKLSELLALQRELCAEAVRKEAHGMTKCEGNPEMLANAAMNAVLRLAR